MFPQVTARLRRALPRRCNPFLIGACSMLPWWADVLVVAAIPVILLTVLRLWGSDDPDNTTVHEQDDDEGSRPDPVAAAA